MLKEEAELSRVLDHPAISKVADVGQVEGVHYIAYDYVHGRDLRAIQERLRRGPSSGSGRRATLDGEPKPVALDVAVYVVLRVAEALAHAHARCDHAGRPLGLVHRDVSPSNVLVSFDGAVKLLDFGIARVGLPSYPPRLVRTDAGQIKGTVGYMSPEQVQGEPVDARSDVYSLGVCLWELCTGRRLLEVTEIAAARISIAEARTSIVEAPIAGRHVVPLEPRPVPSARASGAAISPELDRIILKALANSREERYATATHFHADLSRQAGAEGALADPVRVARYVRSLFPEAAAEEAASREESLDMADNKGGSDLDVFEGLAKKGSRAPAPGLTPPPANQARRPTLLGGVGPLPPPVAPPGAKSTPPPVGHDAGARSQAPQAPLTPPGVGAAGAAGAALPPPSAPKKGTPSLPPPVAPPQKSGSSGTLPGLSGPIVSPAGAPALPASAIAPPAGGLNPPPGLSPALPPTPPVPGKSGTLPGLSGPPAPLPPPSRLPPPLSAPLPPPVAPPQAGAGASAGPASTATPVPPPATPHPPRPPAPPFPPAPSAMGAAPLPPPALPAPSAPPAKGGLPAPLPPPAAPPKEKAAGKAAVDMDWDDDEESTHVYDKADDLPLPKPPARVGAAGALMSSSGGAARAVPPPAAGHHPPSHHPPSAPPPPPPVPVAIAMDAPQRRDEPTAIRPRAALTAPMSPPAAAGTSRLAVLLGGAALVVALVVLAVTLMPKKGAIKINVAAKNGAPVGAVDVYIDGQKKCEATPCVVSELEVGTKTIKVIAPGYLPAETSESIEASKEKVITVPIETGGAVAAGTTSMAAGAGSQPGSSTGGGAVLKIGGTDGEKSVRVFVDGIEKGTLPAEIKDVAPGKRTIRFDGGDRYEKVEKSVEVSATGTTDMGDVKLKVIKGQVTLDIVTTGASITLVRRGDKKTEKKLTDAMLKSPPVRLDIDTSESWRLVATKKGFDDFTQDLTFEDGQADKTVKIELFEIGKPPPVAYEPGPSRQQAPPVERDKPEKEASPAVASGSGTLNINSIPVSKVVLDGRPLGSTPKVGVSVPAGSHTVTFIHPDMGKQTVTVQVKSGETKTAAVKFKQ